MFRKATSPKVSLHFQASAYRCTDSTCNRIGCSWRGVPGPRFFADEVDRVERIRKAVAVLDIGGQALLKWADALTPSDEIANAEAAEAEAREAMTAA